MVNLKIVEDRLTPNEVYNWRVYFSASVAAFAAVMIGYSAFIGTSIALSSFKEEFGMESFSVAKLATVSANIVSVYQAGSFFGAFAGYPIGYFLGRKWGLFVAGLIFCIGAILQCVANHKTGLGIMYAGRVIVGFCIGVTSNLAPIYISEVSPATIRGRLIGLYELGWQIGAVIGFFINYGINLHVPKSNKQWLISFAVQLIPGGLLCIGALFITESPRWLASRERSEQALQNLAYLRGLPESAKYVQEEMEDIHTALDSDRKKGGTGFLAPITSLFSSRSFVKRLIVCVLLFVCQNGTGINAINYYSPTIFNSIGVTGLSTSLLTTGVFGIIKFFGAFVWLLFLVDRFGRRRLLLIGSVGGAFSMYYIGAYIAIAQPATHKSSTLSSGSISAMVFFYIWTCFYGPTWNGTPWVVSAEVFPQYVRPASQAFVSASNWLFAFIIARFTPQMFLAMSYGVYIFFATFMIISIAFVYFVLPESRQVPLERMNELFDNDVRPWEAHDIVMSRTRNEVVRIEHDSRRSELSHKIETMEKV
ncbi:MFS quinate transporter QutD [Pholiota conissans]|uniref:Quinate transporter n=1 Tax=Pholiota conissans TaxID=109636 RepID=A0A9P6CYZ1_9AGAR|nr:MFS quinate transporter QutD [Pholiota conissans]